MSEKAYETRGLSWSDQIQSLLHYRWLLTQLVTTDLKLRYRKSFLGVVWSVMNPMLNALILFFVFRAIFKLTAILVSPDSRSLSEIDFFPYVYSGVLLVTFFTQSVLQGSEQIANHTYVLRRVNVPGEIFIISNVLTNTINFFLGLVPLFLYFVIRGHALTWSIILLPFLLSSLTLTALACALFLSIAYIYFQDLRYLMPVLMTLLMYLTPVFYDLGMIGGRTRMVIELNPLVTYLGAFREIMGIRGETSLLVLLIATLLSATAAFLGLRFVHHNRVKVIFLS